MPNHTDLDEWCRQPELQPDPDYSDLPSEAAPTRRPESEGVEDDAAILEKAISQIPSPNIPPGAIPSPTPDILSTLLNETNPAYLDREEREEIARALDNGKGLTPQQRIAVAVILRGSDSASRSDIVRALIDFLVPHGNDTETVWTVRGSQLTVPPESSIVYQQASRQIAGFPVLGSAVMLITDKGNRPLHALPYARAQSLKETGKSMRVQFRQLVPDKSFAKDLILKQLSYLADFVRQDGRTGKGWAQLFGDSKQLVSLHRKAVVEKIKAATGSNTGLRAPGMRNKPHATKGLKKPA